MRRHKRKTLKPAIIYVLTLAILTGVLAGYGSWRKSRALASIDPEITIYYFRSNTPPAPPPNAGTITADQRIVGD